MSTPATPATPATPPTLQEKLQQAEQEAVSVIALFSPQLAAVAESGVALEPILVGFGQMIVGLFKHHASAAAAPAPAQPAA